MGVKAGRKNKMGKILKLYCYLPWAAVLVSVVLSAIIDLTGLAYLAYMGVLAALVMGWDKHLARHGGVRVPEQVLFVWAVLGGALGMVVGMYFFHHKTRHWVFRFFLPSLAAVQLYIVLFGIPSW
jgi:uncharacterized membrane protein YsdA (DUF1294 family)